VSAATTAPARDVAGAAATARRAALAGPLAALVGLVAGLVLSGSATPGLVSDPGAVVRWGLPVVRGVADGASMVTLGALLLVAAVLPAGSSAAAHAARVAQATAVTWTLAAGAVVVLTYADVAGRPVGGPGFGAEIALFVTQIELGRQLLFALVGAALVATAAAGVRRPGGAAAAAALTAVALVPLALTGHAAGAADHETAVSGWWLHVLATGAWAGGLTTLALVAPGLRREAGPDPLPAAAARYSTLAGWAFALVWVSGVATASTRLAGPGDLATDYGVLLLTKVAATAALGLGGWWHRRATLGALGAGRYAAFWRLVAGEVVLMAATVGVAVALSRTAPPVPALPPALPTPAEALTGEPLPPPPSALRYLTETSPDVLWLAAAGGLATAYVLGVLRLRRRGDAWPVHRTVLWLTGCVALLVVTNGGLAVYSDVLFSAHMLQHMAVSMVVPPLLVLGAPVTLALRALPRALDGARGPREWLLIAVHSRLARVLTHPLVVAVLFAGSLVVFYWSPLFGLALGTHVGHELMLIHFLTAGYLFALVLVGTDPGVRRPPYPLRLVLLLATMAFHAFFGIALVSGEVLLQADWFSSLGWGIDALADQQDGGAIAWGLGEVPTLVLALLVAVQWSRSDERDARRQDRQADRDDDAALAAYNAMLGRMDAATARHDGRVDDTRGGRA
jgi:cytochrome c oxidase assembly factor CtaG/putative copper export protein